MKLCNKIVLALAVIMSVCVPNITAGKMKGGGRKERAMKCKGEKPQIAPLMSTMAECVGEIGNNLGKKEMVLKMKICVWDKEGVVVDGKVSEEAFKALPEKLFPENGKGLGDFVYEECVTKQPSNGENLDMEDLYKSLEPLAKCCMKNFKQYCA